jgi:hypothetical protein
MIISADSFTSDCDGLVGIAERLDRSECPNVQYRWRLARFRFVLSLQLGLAPIEFADAR